MANSEILANRIKLTNIFLVEDDKTTAAYYAALIRGHGYQAIVCHQGYEALRLLEKRQDFDLVLLDLGLPDISGWEILSFIKQNQKLRYIPVLVVTATDDKVSFLKALQQGAEDYLVKPVDVDTLINRMEVMLRIRGLYSDLQSAPPPINQHLRKYLARHMGPSLVVSQLAQQMELLIDHETTVLLQGEAGVGKKMLAEAVHRFSSRSGGPMLRLRCGAGGDAGFLNKLLGVARPFREGLLDKAAGGTIYLQNIDELGPMGQLAVLQIIQDQQFKRIGGDESIKADIHILVSTTKDLKYMVEHGLFREDLFYRLGVVTLKVPSLRSRLEDISFLAQKFLWRKFGEKRKTPLTLSPMALQALQSYPWRGNVRELLKVLECAGAKCQGSVIGVEHLPIKEMAGEIAGPAPLAHSLAEQERRLVMETLRITGGNKRRAAMALGISRSTLYNKMAAWGMKT